MYIFFIFFFVPVHDETSIEALADLHIYIANFLNLTKGLKKIILVVKSLHGCGKMTCLSVAVYLRPGGPGFFQIFFLYL